MEKINGIIVNGRVYEVRARKGWNCSPCLLSQDTIGFCYSQELTDKLKDK